MTIKKSKWLILFFIFPFLTASAALGNHSGEYSEIAGCVVGIYFLWSLIKIIRNGNYKEEPEIDENQIDLLDHFIENNPPKEK